jgi:hypothetical protein
MAIPPLFPGATFIDLGPDGGAYDETQRRKALHHMTQGSTLLGAERTYKDFPPHLGYDVRFRSIHQYIRMDRHSLALRGAESDDECVFQIEIVGFSEQSHLWPDEWCQNYGEDIIRPLREIYGVPDIHIRFYGADEGIVLATSRSPIRLSDANFRSFSGHLGHQHVPAPDEHWDPGRLQIQRCIEYSRVTEETVPTVGEIVNGVWWTDVDPKEGEPVPAWITLHYAEQRTVTIEQKVDDLEDKVNSIQSDVADIKAMLESMATPQQT